MGPADATLVYYLGVGTFLACVVVLLFGRRIERTLELLNWVMVACILGGFLVLAVAFVPPGTWLGAALGFAGFVALRLAQPVVLLQLGANVAGVVIIVASLHLLYVNTRLLPPQLRPPRWRSSTASSSRSR